MDDRESRKYQWLEDNSGDPIDDNSSKSRKAPAVSPSDSRKHPLPPEKYFGCSYKNCRASGYASNDDLVRHKKIVHGEITYGKSFVCHHSPCTKKKDIGFWPRADLFCDHLLRVHNLKLKAEDAIREYANQNVEIGGSANFSGPSHVPDAQENRPDRYSSDFAAHLLNRLSQQPLDAETAQRVVHRLPNLLKCYALKPIDYVSSSQNDILFHVYRNRRRIARRFGVLNEQSLLESLVSNKENTMNIKEPLPERLSRELNQIFALLPSEHRRQEWIQGLQKTILDRSYADSKSPNKQMNIEELIQFQQQSTQLIREKLHPMQLPDYIKELIVQSAQQIFRSFYFDSVATLAPAETTTTAERRHEVSKLGGEKLGALRNRDEPNVEHTKPLGSTSFENVDVSYGDAFSGLEYGVALNHEAFEWLLSRLDREIQPASTAETINDIGHAIETHLPLSDFSNDFHGFSFVADHHATFTIHCDTYSFWQSQLIDSSKTKTLSNLITITGSSQDAQALTCGQYLSQTWPITGPQVLGRLNLIFTMDTKFSREIYLNDGTVSTMHFQGDQLVTEVFGTSASIIDLGEMLAWLGATLQSSPNPLHLAYCMPKISHVLEQPKAAQGSHYRISFEIEEIEEIEDLLPTATSNGRCWHHLFNNPVIIRGYPITPKVRSGSGIEIPLNIMAALVGSRKVDEFEGRNFIKGFSKMLVPAQKDGDIVYWHLYHSESGKRIPFWHPTTSHAAYINNLQLEGCRHILGWTLEAEFCAGSSQAKYEIENSFLESPGTQSLFSGLSVSQGSVISGGPSFMVCRKDINVTLIGRIGYTKRLKWLAKQRLLLWDDFEKRGWLVNGLSALLHLVRAFLHKDSSSISSSQFHFQPDSLQKPKQNKWLPNAAAYMLFSEHNQALRVYDEENGTFRDYVDLFYNILEKLIDYQKRVSGDNGADMSCQPRRILEGWDFHDIMMNHDDRVFPRIATLEPAGICWVDFIRSSSVVTLFGRGFGELIKPTGTLCSRWEKLPLGKSYIAASLFDLKDLMNIQQLSQTYTRLGRSIWHTETELFQECSCEDSAQHDAHEPVQSVVPQFMSRDLPGRESSIPMSVSGAVIFGNHSKSSLVWSDFGPPSTGIMSVTFKNTDAQLSDSGIGSSLKSLTVSGKTHSVPSVPETHTQTLESSAGFQHPPWKQIHDPKSYTVGIICALAREFLVVRALLDKTFSPSETPECIEDDTNIYAFGQMGRHLVVSTCLPSGNYGNNPAAMCAGHMRRSFGSLQFCFLVGVGGGIPSTSADIWLGDVVVSCGVRDLPAVIQYDRGKENDDGVFERTGCLPNPPTRLLGAIAHIQSDPKILSLSDPLEAYREEIRARVPRNDEARYRHPGLHLDSLLERPDSPGPCRPKQRVSRATTDPVIHYGPIGSGNKVIKSAEFRDLQARKDGILCFDMEAAGVAIAFPSQLLVVRGICDYSDAQKNKDWQDYAAANAAAYVKLLLSILPATTRWPARERRGALPEAD